MNKTNCPNCGAALPQFGGKCEFCGTRVVDLTMLDFDAQEPTMFLLQLPKSITGEDSRRVFISMWARPQLESMTMEPETMYCYGRNGEKLTSFTTSMQVAFGMSLHPCTDPRDNSMFKVETVC